MSIRKFFAVKTTKKYQQLLRLKNCVTVEKVYNFPVSGHSKWSTIKRHKQATDAARGQIFTKLANQITVSVREGGGVSDPQTNFRLRLAIEKAREANMPKANVERAIERAQGKGGDASGLAQVLYEGFGPANVAILAEGVTDNKQRTAAQVKNIFIKKGGHLGALGSVTYLFDKVGEIRFTKENMTYDKALEIALETGAIDIEEDQDSFSLYTESTAFHRIKEELIQKDCHIEEADLIYKPKTTIDMDDKGMSDKIVSLLTALDDLEDIQKVYTNADFHTANL